MNSMQLRFKAYDNRREQQEAISAALVKIQMMGLTIDNCMVECPPPPNVHPFRWKAMLASAINNGGFPE